MRRRGFAPGQALAYAFLIILAVVMVYPLVWMIANSLKTNLEFIRFPWSIPASPKWSNYTVAFTEGRIGRYALNSLIVTFTSIVGVILVSSLAAYGMAKLKPWGSDVFYYFVLVGLMIPPQLIVLPLFIMLLKAKLLNTYLALIFPYIGLFSPFSAFLLKGFYSVVQRDVMDAARIDGCTNWAIYWRITIPLLAPGIGVVTILTGTSIWNEFLFALVFIRNVTMRTLPSGLVTFVLEHQTLYSLLFAGISIAIIPLIVIAITFQRTIVKGLTEGAVKF